MFEELLNKTYRQIFSYNENIGHQFVPNLNARIINEKGGYYVRTNSSGFRSDIEFKKEKNNKPRILFFGDSNTAADGVSNGERFSDLVGENFKADVYNYGLSGSGTDQQYLIWKEYARDIKADLIVLGILVENIERNKVALRESINSFTKERSFIPKPYFDYEDNKLILKNYPVPRINDNFSAINKDMVQWAVPKGREFIYNLVKLWRTNKLLKPLRKNFEKPLKKLRSYLISAFYQPYPDYKNPSTRGYILMKEILKKFTESLAPTPVIILPIPTYHYYVDGAKPIYNKFFNNFHNNKKNLFVFDPLKDLKSLDFNTRQTLSFKHDKGHFSQFGHKKISELLIKQINKYKILPSSKKKVNVEIGNKINKSVYVLGISAFYHDSAATLIKDGKIIASAQEERFSRTKNDRRFPISAINYCLEREGIQQTNLNAIVYYDNTSLTLERILWGFLRTAPNSEKGWLRAMPSWIKYKFFLPQLIRKKLNYDGQIFQNLHHRSHAASAFFPSPYKKSAILTVDGVGEWATASIGMGEDNNIKILKEMNYPNSLGLLYSAFTQFTGFKVNSGEYKMMGLAPYGKPIYADVILEKLINLKDDGSIEINQNYFSYLDASAMTNKKFSDLFGGHSRIPETRITHREMNLASSIQKVTEKIIIQMAKYAKKLTQAENLCMSGGVALNCVANGRLLKENLFKDIWIQPAAGDAGSSLGCALDFYHSYLKNPRHINSDGKSLQLGSYLGPEWNMDEIKSFLDTENIEHDLVESSKRSYLIAKYLNEGKVIGHFSGRSEFGPRALGARSIIGDPRNKEMQTTINLKIKNRESFRPFAPTVLVEKVSEYFELNKKSPYMMLVAPVLEKRRLPFNKGNKENMLEIIRQPRSDIPAVTHIDYSARIQTIEKNDHKKFYNAIKAFEDLTGYGVIINTSFNVRGEPIVNSPMDAYSCFMKTEMDILLIEDFVIIKKNQKKKLKKNIENLNNSNLSKEEKLIKQKLKKLYKDYFLNGSQIINRTFNDKINKQSFWSNFDKKDLRNVFIIEKDLDATDPDPQKMSKSIIKNWKNNSFGKAVQPFVVRLLSLAKKFPIEENINTEVSETIYEMF